MGKPPPPYQNYIQTFKNIKLKVDYHTAGKWFIYGQKYACNIRSRWWTTYLPYDGPREESVSKPEPLLLIILSSACESDIKEV